MTDAISSMSAFRAKFHCLLCGETMISPTVCGDCLSAYYCCSKDCQATDLKVHTIVCERRNLCPSSAFPTRNSKTTLSFESNPAPDIAWVKFRVCSSCGTLTSNTFATPPVCRTGLRSDRWWAERDAFAQGADKI
jgi:hypothetical protein